MSTKSRKDNLSQSLLQLAESQTGLRTKIGVMDMGFNSLKLVIYDVRDHNNFSVLQKETVQTRLGKGIDRNGYLHLDAIERVVDGLKLFADILSLESVKQVIGVATSGVRDCINKDAFLKKVKKETGFSFKVLSGRDEALCSFKGAAKSVSPRPNFWFFDIGGGSLEMVVSENFLMKRVFSLPLGGLRLANRFPSDKDGYEKMRAYILDSLPGKKDVDVPLGMTLLGVGGTLRALARFEQEETDYPLNKIHNYPMNIESLKRVFNEIRSMEPDELEENDSIGPGRADTIVAGSLVVELLMEKLNFRELLVSTHGLRDGALAMYLEDESWFESGSKNPVNPRIFSSPTPEPSQAGEVFSEGNLSPSSSEVIDSFFKRYLISEKDKKLISYIVLFLLLKRPPYSAETVFDTIIDQDSYLSHKDQLLLALAIVRTMSPKTADRLLIHYRSLLKPKTKPVLKKLGALAKFLEFVEKTGCRVAMIPGGANEIRMRVTPNSLKSDEAFPKQLLERLARDLSYAFAMVVNYELDERAPPNPPISARIGKQ